jgi:hypothetical protein
VAGALGAIDSHPSARMRIPSALQRQAGAPGERVMYDLEGCAHARTGRGWATRNRDKGAPFVGRANSDDAW